MLVLIKTQATKTASAAPVRDRAANANKTKLRIQGVFLASLIRLWFYGNRRGSPNDQKLSDRSPEARV
jgi:hypothetical protein